MRVYNRDTGETYDVYDDGSGGSGGVADVVLIFVFIAFGLALAGALVINLTGLLMDTLTDNGILKTKIVAYWDVSEDSEIDMEEVQLVFLSLDEENGEYVESSYSFDTKKESCQLKLLKGKYAIYYEYDGEKFSIESFEASGWGKYELTIDDDSFLVVRVVQITFRNDNGDLLYPEQISIVNADGDEHSVDLLGNGKYSVLLYDDCGKQTWTITIPGYGSTEIVFDGEVARVLDIEVVLHEDD